MKKLFFILALWLSLGIAHADEEFTDAFTRADNTDLGASYDSGYTGANNLQIVTNEVRATTVGADSAETYSGTISSADQYAQVTITAIDSGGVVGVLLRASAPATRNWVQVYVNTAGSTIQVIDGATNPVIFTDATAWAVSDVLRVSAIGSEFRLYRNEALIGTVTDTTFASGRVGILVNHGTTLANARVDNFVAGDTDGCNFAMNAAASAFLLNDATSKIRRNTSTGCPAGSVVQQNLTLMGVGN